MLILRIILRIWLSNILLSISGVVTGSTDNNSRCLKGHFKSSTGECFPCIDGCFRCNNTETCAVCEIQYTKTDLGTCKLCSKNCNECDLNECTTCNNGYFLLNKSCVSCPNKCQKCNSLESCTKCTSGSWGPRCDKTCQYNCSMDICNIATGNCDACEKGLYGINCSKCPNNCLNNLCDISGHCTVGCVAGFYGVGCTQQCPNTCKSCWTESNCNQCSSGYYGLVCNFDCSTCKDSVCIKFACSYGCKTGFYMDGIECKHCSTNCKACNSSDVCSQCQDGYYGPVCEFNCSHCKNSTCDKLSCIYGCKSGFYSDRSDCKHCRKNCKACYSSDQCSQCQDGYYGPVCQFDCSKCQYSKCNELSCVYGCKTGFYLDGNECKQCRPNCTACKYKNRCSECEDGKYGRLCQNDCDKFKCLACKGNASNCTKCHAGYKLDGNKCCSLYCQKCDGDGQCNNCTDGTNCTKSCQNKCDKAVLPEGPDSIFVPLVITVSIIVLLAIIVFGAFLVRHYKSRISVREKSVRMNDIDTETGVQRQKEESDSEEEVITENETYGMFEVPLSVVALEVERARQINSREPERDTYVNVGVSPPGDSDAVYAVPDKRKYK